MRTIKTLTLAACLIGAGTYGARAQNLVQNPSFETMNPGTAPSSGGFSPFSTGGTTAATTIPNWIVTASSVDVHNLNHLSMGVPTGGGNQHLDINTDGEITQTISLPAAGTYSFSFWRSVHANISSGCGTVTATAKITDASNVTLVGAAYSLTAANKTWTYVPVGTFSVASAMTIKVKFAGTGNSTSCSNDGGMLVDLINVESRDTNNCSDKCYWKVTGNNILNGNNIFGTLTNNSIQIQTTGSNRGIIANTGQFGWNTSAPTALMHVNCAGFNTSSGTSDVRFENLEAGTGNILAIGQNGYVFNTGIPASGGTNWSLTGNTGTAPTANWLGTNDNVSLAVRTNNLERLRVTNQGDVGIGLSFPDRMFQVHSNSPDRHIGASGKSPSYSLYDFSEYSKSGYRARIGLATLANDFISGSAGGDLALHADLNGAMLFGVGSNASGGIERMRIDQHGFVGINTGSSLSDRFHIILDANNSESVRIENMLPGHGHIVVIDDDGRLWRANQEAHREAPGENEEVAILRSQVTALAARVDALTGAKDITLGDAAAANALGQNIPNPFGAETVIPYRITKMSRTAFIAVYDLNGRELSRHPIAGAGQGQITLKSADLASGTYLYSLIIDGAEIATKRMVLAK